MNKKPFFLSLLWRSFFLQGLWNFEGLQNAGFLYTMLPLLKKLYPDPASRKEAVKRHLEFFNTQPYMASLVYGFVARLEEEKSQGKPVKAEEISAIKRNLAGPLAAMGDALFWGSFRPFAAVLTTGIIFFALKQDRGGLLFLVPLFFILFYNAVQLSFRYWGIAVSYELGQKTIEKVVSINFQRLADIIRMTAAIVIFFAAAYYVYAFSFGSLWLVVYIAVFALSVVWAMLKWHVSLLFYLAIAVCVISQHLFLH